MQNVENQNQNQLYVLETRLDNISSIKNSKFNSLVF